MYNFVIFSLSRWNIEFGCNIKDISIELSKHHKVLYVDVPLKRKERLFNTNSNNVKEVKERIKSNAALVKVSDNLWHYIGDVVLESVNSIQNSLVFDSINKINNKRFSKLIKRAVREVGFDEFILINDNDIYNGFYIKNLVNPKLYVYYLRDRLPAMQYWRKQTSRLEPMLIAKADVIVANSQYLADYAKSFNPKSTYVGQGCDIEHFLSPPRLTEIGLLYNQIMRPIVGYMGALNSERLDLNLLERLCELMKDFSFVFVGKEDSAFENSALHTYENVYFLGQKDFSELPKYLYGFDVAINPQLVNEITVGNYPRKVDEYLASGKPVVATKTIAMEPFSEFVNLANGVESYESMLRNANSTNSEEVALARQKFVKNHTWQNSVGEILKAINDFLA
jgi:teichuronic acid biosynthesis glycosyltransferase TuaH